MTHLTGMIPARLNGNGRTEDRRATRLETAWLLREQATAPPSSPILTRDVHTAVPVSADEPTLIILSDAVPAVAEFAAAAAAIRTCGRVYCLAPADWAAPDWLRNAPSTKVLIRRVPEPPVAAVLSDAKGWLWMGPNGPGEWRLVLDATQVAAARRAFLELYWNHANDEAWPTRGKIQWHARGDAPFDLPAALPEATVRLEPGGARLPAPDPSASVYCSDGHLPDGPAARVWVRASGEGHAMLAAAVRWGTDVIWSDLSLPSCVTGTHAAMLPSTTRWSLPVVLTSQQATALADVLGQQPDATFRIGIGLGEAEARLGQTGRVWRAGQPQPEALLNEQDLDAGVVPARSLRDMPATEPSSWPAPAVLALSAHWSWQINAPQAPKGAAGDPLVKAWRALDQGYTARVESALAALAEVEKKQGALERAFATLKGALLGFMRSSTGLRADLLKCAAAEPSASGPDGAQKRMSQLAELEAQVTSLREELAEAERQAREHAERKRQEQEHALAQQKAKDELTAHTQELHEKQQRLAEIETELGDLARATDLPKKDRKVKHSKLRGDMNRVEQEIRRLDRQMEQAQATIDKAFEYRPPIPVSSKRSTASFVPQPANRTNERVPNEALPTVGHLLRAGKERLLAISRWEELDQGEAEAKRLGARLVAATEET